MATGGAAATAMAAQVIWYLYGHVHRDVQSDVQRDVWSDGVRRENDGRLVRIFQD